MNQSEIVKKKSCAKWTRTMPDTTHSTLLLCEWSKLSYKYVWNYHRSAPSSACSWQCVPAAFLFVANHKNKAMICVRVGMCVCVRALSSQSNIVRKIFMYIWWKHFDDYKLQNEYTAVHCYIRLEKHSKYVYKNWLHRSKTTNPNNDNAQLKSSKWRWHMAMKISYTV